MANLIPIDLTAFFSYTRCVADSLPSSNSSLTHSFAGKEIIRPFESPPSTLCSSLVRSTHQRRLEQIIDRSSRTSSPYSRRMRRCSFDVDSLRACSSRYPS